MEISGIYLKGLTGEEIGGISVGAGNIFFGTNGSGKTRILDAISSALEQQPTHVDSSCALLLKLSPKSHVSADPTFGQKNIDDYFLEGLNDDLHNRDPFHSDNYRIFSPTQSQNPEISEQVNGVGEWTNDLNSLRNAILFNDNKGEAESIISKLRPRQDDSIFGDVPRLNNLRMSDKAFAVATEVSITNFVNQLLTDLFLWHEQGEPCVLFGRIRRSNLTYYHELEIDKIIPSLEASRPAPKRFEIIPLDSGLVFDQGPLFALVDEDFLYFPLVRIASKENKQALSTFLPRLNRADENAENISYNLTNAVGNVANRLMGNGHESFNSKHWGDPSDFQWFQKQSGGSTGADVNGAVKLTIIWLQELSRSLMPSFLSDEFDLHIILKSFDELSTNDRIEVKLYRKRTQDQIDKTSIEGNVDLTNPEQLKNYLREVVPDSLKLQEAGRGIIRWISIVLSIAANSMLATQIQLQSKDFKQESILLLGGRLFLENDVFEDEVSHINFDDYEEVQKLSMFNVVPEFKSTVLIIDEPEAYLHPKAIRSVAAWLEELSTNYSARSFVATHNPYIFNITADLFKKFEMKRTMSNKNSFGIHPRMKHPSEVDDFMKTVGITDGEATLMVSKWLFVEGFVDKTILDEWFSSIFVKDGIRIISGQGVRDLEHLFELQVIPAIGGDILVLIDSESHEGISPEKELAKTIGAKGKKIPQFLRSMESGIESADELDMSSRYISITKHDKQDIFLQLNIDSIKSWTQNSTVREKQPTIKTWPVAWGTWKEVENEFAQHVKSGCSCRSFSNKKESLSGKFWVKHFKKFFYDNTGIAWSVENAKTFASMSPPSKEFSDFFTAFIQARGVTWIDYFNRHESAIFNQQDIV